MTINWVTNCALTDSDKIKYWNLVMLCNSTKTLYVIVPAIEENTY